MSEREYLDGLEYARASLAKTADERVELDKKVYAQQKAMLAESLAELEQAEQDKRAYYGGTIDETLAAYKAFYDEMGAAMGREQTKDFLRQLTELTRQAEDERVALKKAALDEELAMGKISRQAYANDLAEGAAIPVVETVHVVVGAVHHSTNKAQ